MRLGVQDTLYKTDPNRADTDGDGLSDGDGDAGFSGGWTDTTRAAITGTADDRLHQSWRCSNFSYAIPTAIADYLVTLKFADNLWPQAGQRVFNMSMEGKVVVRNAVVNALKVTAKHGIHELIC